jgi:hypothetical protein
MIIVCPPRPRRLQVRYVPSAVSQPIRSRGLSSYPISPYPSQPFEDFKASTIGLLASSLSKSSQDTQLQETLALLVVGSSFTSVHPLSPPPLIFSGPQDEQHYIRNPDVHLLRFPLQTRRPNSSPNFVFSCTLRTSHDPSGIAAIRLNRLPSGPNSSSLPSFS